MLTRGKGKIQNNIYMTCAGKIVIYPTEQLLIICYNADHMKTFLVDYRLGTVLFFTSIFAKKPTLHAETLQAQCLTLTTLTPSYTLAFRAEVDNSAIRLQEMLPECTRFPIKPLKREEIMWEMCKGYTTSIPHLFAVCVCILHIHTYPPGHF